MNWRCIFYFSIFIYTLQSLYVGDIGCQHMKALLAAAISSLMISTNQASPWMSEMHNVRIDQHTGNYCTLYKYWVGSLTSHKYLCVHSGMVRQGLLGSSSLSMKMRASLQIIIFYKSAIGQAREKVWPDMQPVWSNKKEFQCNKIT